MKERKSERELLSEKINRNYRIYMKSGYDEALARLFESIEIARMLGFEVKETDNGYSVKEKGGKK